MFKMSESIARQAVHATLDVLQEGLGEHLLGLFLYGSLAQRHYVPGRSDVNLIAIISEGADMFALREAYLPAWWRYRAVLRRPPLIARQHAFIRHLKLYPTLASHLIKQGERLAGSIQIEEPKLNVQEAMAELVAEAMDVSQAITPKLLPADESNKPRWRLYRLARRLGIDVSGTTGPVHLFGLIQERLAAALSKMPDDWQPQRLAGAPPLIPDLQAIYLQSDSLIFVLPEFTPGGLYETDWEGIGAQVEGQCDGLRLTNPQQLRLAIEYVYPLEHLLTSFQLDWGADILADVSPEKRYVMRGAGRMPSTYEIDLLPQKFLTCEEDELGKLIHDFQNRLLNVQLRHELLIRFKHAATKAPPESLPDRTEVPARRIGAIFRHFNWWANYYTNRMLNYDR